MTTAETKEHLITVRADAAENERANAVAAHYGLNVSSMIRMLIKREARTLGIEPASTKTKKAAK